MRESRSARRRRELPHLGGAGAHLLPAAGQCTVAGVGRWRRGHRGRPFRPAPRRPRAHRAARFVPVAPDPLRPPESTRRARRDAEPAIRQASGRAARGAPGPRPPGRGTRMPRAGGAAARPLSSTSVLLSSRDSWCLRPGSCARLPGQHPQRPPPQEDRHRGQHRQLRSEGNHRRQAGAEHEIFRLSAVEGAERLPFSLKVLLENLLRTEDGANVTADHIRALAGWDPTAEPDTEIQFTPARVIMQDFTGVPVRRRPRHHARGRHRARRRPGQGQPARARRAGHRPLGDRRRVRHGRTRSSATSTSSTSRNKERYQFLRWGQGAFDEFKVVPPGTGIVHQVNIEHLARVVMTARRPGLPGHAASAPTRTPRWSTASACSAGASAASRPRPRCSASRCRCSSPGSSASS